MKLALTAVLAVVVVAVAIFVMALKPVPVEAGAPEYYWDVMDDQGHLGCFPSATRKTAAEQCGTTTYTFDPSGTTIVYVAKDNTDRNICRIR